MERPRLYRILDSPLVRLCIVQGPSGSGKTTLVRSWVMQQDQDRVITWIALGPKVTNRQAFWRHAASSAMRMNILTDERAERVDEQLGAGVDPVDVAIDDVGAHGPMTWVIDGYEHLGDLMSEIDDDLTRLVAAVPGLRIIVTTRARTRLADRDVPGGVTRVIALNELALTADEIGELLSTQSGIDDPELARDVARATRGFPLTVRSVALALAQLGRVPRMESREWDAVVAARLESLLPDEATVAFVTHTSVAPYVDADLAQQLTGASGAVGILNTLERNGFGRWVPYSPGHPVFQYVEAIRDSFRARAAQDAERFADACVATAEWLFENGEADQALRFAIQAHDYALADRIFAALVTSHADSYTTDRLLGPLREVPESVLPEYPMLAFGLALALMASPVHRLDAPRVFRMVVDSTAHPAYAEPSVDAFLLAGTRALAHREVPDQPAATTASHDAVRLLDAIPPAVLAEHGDNVGAILRQVSYTLLQGGEIAEAIDAARRAVAMSTTATTRGYSVIFAAVASAFDGDLVDARAFLEAANTRAWPESLRTTYMNGPGIITRGFLLLDDFDFAGALQSLRGSIEFAPTSEFWPFLTAISISARHGLGQAHADAVRVTRELAGPTPPGIGDNVATEHLYAVLARAWMSSGHLQTAGELLDARPPGSAVLAGARTARMLAEGRERDAFAYARELLEHPAHTTRTRAELWTTGAVAALRAGDAELAWWWLTNAAVTWETNGPRVHVAAMSSRDRRQLWELARDRDAEAVQHYLDAPALPQQVSGGEPVTLTPREQVVLRALAEHTGAKQIAESLFVSPHTVKTQLRGLYRKLGVSSRQAALATARDLGLLAE
ncbi:LuxR C-terminal-related transcriptional regulator [Microbacterium sp. No. 7]|uniref:LuxR C-terminal-related transcriptional regulator n=1 Tax=Microbacterium sp. No. 7 TaxID=1714373 RepID=UPI0012E1357D|nr:LuxR C-terminal-related transcriptional regulator [Microbacterium sp. No. 7]